MTRTSPGLQALKRKEARDKMWAEYHARIEARAAKATPAIAARDALSWLDTYRINHGPSESLDTVIAQLKATLNKPIWLCCFNEYCPCIAPFRVYQDDIDRAGGFIECDHCGEECIELVGPATPESRLTHLGIGRKGERVLKTR